MGRLARIRFQSERAAGLVEWGLLVVLIAVVALVAVQFAGDQNSVLWSEIASSVEK